ncbi:hypothetical protein M885DRAFT_507902 [Pelagophyceae sp. CCMP2097]|nr:hypothetical protein M885DRAFT_507902 [Pelagophyceae sp. CCMP2097]|mmetsp:Transcript_2967/g.8845  ORF Transcript_2967/g.8845 Transcript_2967/m.8845 type:complete len:159 (-) Transcript_2967:19-495(-)
MPLPNESAMPEGSEALARRVVEAFFGGLKTKGLEPTQHGIVHYVRAVTAVQQWWRSKLNSMQCKAINDSDVEFTVLHFPQLTNQLAPPPPDEDAAPASPIKERRRSTSTSELLTSEKVEQQRFDLQRSQEQLLRSQKDKEVRLHDHWKIENLERHSSW